MIVSLLCIVLALHITGCDDNVSPGPDPFAGLPTDEELTTAEDRLAVAVDGVHVDWIVDNARLVRSLDADNFADLRFLEPLLAGRTLVQLGESAHGVAEFSAAKVRLIRYLHEELEFDVIAFESSMYECWDANRRRAELAPEDVMRNSIFGVWHTEEVLELFRYIEETSESERPLILAGFDVQISSFRGLQGRPSFLREVLAPVDSQFAERVGALDELFLLQATSAYVQFLHFLNTQGNTFTALYRDVVETLDTHVADLIDTHGVAADAVIVARQTAWSMIQFIEQVLLLDKDPAQATFIRDGGMARNIRVLVHELFPGKKILVWAHNFHVRHDEPSVLGSGYARANMGSWVEDEFRPTLYTVGLFMYRGQAAQNDRQIYNVQPASERSIESILYRVRKKYVFVDMLGQVEEPGNSWMFELSVAKAWGWSDLELIPRDQYDALLFIDTVRPPDYIRWKVTTAAMQMPAKPMMPCAWIGRAEHGDCRGVPARAREANHSRAQ